MTFFQSIILGVVQGLTEFIPISSSGHLIIFPELLGWEKAGLAFDTTLHLGTLTALLIYFRKDVLGMIVALVGDFKVSRFNIRNFSPEGKLVLWLLIATVPAGLLGFFLDDFFENTFRSSFSVAIFLILGSVLMFYADYRSAKKGFSFPVPPLSLKKVFTAGLFQCLALFPGFSRSGATISGGLLTGLHRGQAARTSFLLSIPLIAAAGLLQLPEALGGASAVSNAVLATGFVSSALSGYIAVAGLMRFINNHGLRIFVTYRLILAMFLMFTYFF